MSSWPKPHIGVSMHARPLFVRISDDRRFYRMLASLHHCAQDEIARERLKLNPFY